jgi:hypothetical protein
MTPRLAPTLLLVAVVVSAGIFAACRSRSDVKFPHAAHLAGLDCGGPAQPECLTCNTCHTPSSEDRVGKLPDRTQCDGCHEGDATMLAAVLTNEPHRPYGTIAFDHDRHLAMSPIGGQCVPCHSGVVKAGARAVPPMSQCFTCHEHQEQWNQGECAPCHAASDLDRILPQSFLRHEGNFAKDHGQLSASDQRLCQACHTQAECNDCHDVTQQFAVERRKPASIERSFVHRGDFMVRHAIEAQSQPSACVRCHEPATCDACHTLRGVSGNVLGAANPHPPGWVGTDTQSSSFHAREARRDILSCAGCHEQGAATNCIRCHKVGAYGGNPHPEGWKSSRAESSEMCRYCHG